MERKIIKIGTVTIGQSPRTDITGEIIPMLGDRFVLIEKGALDNLTDKYILENIAPKNNEDVLVSRMRDGTQVRIDKNKIIALIQEKIYELDEMGVDVIVLLCNEKFPEFEHKMLLFKPEEILHSMAAKLAGGMKVGVFMPDKSQVPGIIELWKQYGVEVKAVGASPYIEDNLEEEARKFTDSDIRFIFMECLGYSSEMKELVMKEANKPVFLSRTMIFKIIQEMF